MTNSPVAVSVKPSSFADDRPDLSILSLEEVVARFKDVEKKRNINTTPEVEAEVPWMVRSAPVELVSSLKVVSARLGVARSVLTKCMSRQVMDWYSNSLGLDRLVTEYEGVYAKIKLRGYTTLRIQAENPSKFSYANQPEDTRTSLSTIRWVIGKLGDVRDIIGVKRVDLLLVGLAWSLTTLANREWDEVNIIRYFLPEANNISILIRDRLVDVKALREKYEIREDL